MVIMVICWQYRNFLHSIVLVLLFLNLGAAIEDYELDLYDLVEEVNGTFYEFMGVQEDCESSQIRRAYRRLSLLLHPDKNKEADAELKFRQLVGIYEILKSPEKRQKYNEVLEHGLPDWRQPIYYYRKVRKFGFMESGMVLIVTVSVIHFAMVWAAYWEKKYEIEEVYQGRLKKNSKRRNHLDKNEELLEEMQLEINKLNYLSHKVNDEELDDTEDGDGGGELTKKKVRGDEVFANMTTPEMAPVSQPVTYQENVPVSDRLAEKPVTTSSTANKKVKWTDLDDSKLARAMQKFPQGTALRWERIAQQLNQTPAEVLKRAKQLKTTNFTVSADRTQIPAVEIKKRVLEALPQGGISVRESETVPQTIPPSQQPIPNIEWSQIQQKALENALTAVPKTVPDRWGEISKLVPGKSKVECIARFKYLAEMVKQRKSTNPG